MTDQQQRWDLVGSVIRDAIEPLPESFNQIAARLDVSPNKLRDLRDGKAGNYRRDTLVKVSLGLWGDPGTLHRVLAADGAPAPEHATELLDLALESTRDLEGDERVEALRQIAADMIRAAEELEAAQAADIATNHAYAATTGEDTPPGEPGSTTRPQGRRGEELERT